MKYLYTVQAMGLQALWTKVLTGQVPPRCSPEWFFRMFCWMKGGETPPPAEEIGGNISEHRNGSMKPCDVCALVMVLPGASRRFAFDQEARTTSSRLLV